MKPYKLLHPILLGEIVALLTLIACVPTLGPATSTPTSTPTATAAAFVPSPTSPAPTSTPAQPSATIVDRQPPTATPVPPSPTVAPTSATCATTDQDLYVYNPGRLRVKAACQHVTGTIEAIRNEADGDLHILLKLDPEFVHLLTPANQGEELGDLVIEPVCIKSVTQADAVATCANDPDPLAGPFPAVGQHVWMEGRYVLDTQHGSWAELHPLYRWGPEGAPPAGTPAPSATRVPILPSEIVTFTPAPAQPSATQAQQIEPTATEAAIAPSDTPAPADTATPAGPRVRVGALCNDGTSSNATGSGACSHHGGVKCWKYSDGTCTKP
jgi:hypothetical protein